VSADPRVEAVAGALAELPFIRTGFLNRRRVAAAAVDALDAYDGPKFSSVVHECCERPTEVDLRAAREELDEALGEATRLADIVEGVFALARDADRLSSMARCPEWADKILGIVDWYET
jgi:hypothetical protein